MPDGSVHVWQAEEGNEGRKEPKGSSRAIYDFIIAFLCIDFGFLSFVGGDAASGLLAVGLVFLGLFFIVRGVQWRTLIALCKKYVVLLNARPTTSVADFAAALGISPDEAMENVELLINGGMLEGIVIDRQAKKFVCNAPFATGNSESAPAEQRTGGFVEVECQGCGARKSIASGTVSTCDHCGADLHA